LNFETDLDPVFGLGRSTGRSTVPITCQNDRPHDRRNLYNWGVHVMHIPDRMIGRLIPFYGQPGSRSTVSMLVSVGHGRPTGWSPANSQIF